MKKQSSSVRAIALSKLADACEQINPEAATVLRKASGDVAAGVAVMTGPLAVLLRDTGIDAAVALTACRIAR